MRVTGKKEKVNKSILFGGISVLIILVYYPITDSYFVNDDFYLIYLSSPKTVNGILDFFTSTKGGWVHYRPIVKMAFFMDFSLYHLNPVGYHFTNLLFHLSSTIMVFYLARILTGSEKAGGFAALIFAVHPLHIEAVPWISGRNDLIFTFFYLSAVLSFLKYISTEEKKKKIYLIVSISFSSLSLLSKESAITLPLLLFLAELLYRQKESKDNRLRINFMKYIPFLFILFLYILIRFHVIKGSVYNFYPVGLQTLLRVSYHSFQLFAPINIDTFNFSNWFQFILNLVIVLNFTVPFIAYLYFSKDKREYLYLFIYCSLWILITFFPLYFLPGVRFLYISSVASSVLLGFIIMEATEGVKKYNIKVAQIISVPLVISVLLAFSIRTIQRNHIYNYAGNIAKEILSEIENKYTYFPEGSVLYLINFPHEWIKDTETWVKAFLDVKAAIEVKFSDKSFVVYRGMKNFQTSDEKLHFLERNFIEKYLTEGKPYYILEYQDGRVIETTDFFIGKLKS